jgi:PPP family 3-phenylpropionic acid transporter
VRAAIRGEQTAAAPAGRWRGADRRVGLGYFWYFAAVGAFFPFAAIWFLELGLSGAEVGVLVALPAVGAAFSGPLWGAAADARARHRVVLCTALAVAALAALAAAWADSFLPLLVLLGVSALAAGPIAPLLDAFAVTVGTRLGRSYGAMRVAGSVGYTLAALGVGRLMGERATVVFLVAYAGCLGLALVAAVGLPDLGERQPRPLLGGLHELRRNRPFVALLLVAYLTAAGAAIMNGFLGVRLVELGGTAGLVGLAIGLGAASEWPVVALGGWLLARFGPARLVALAIVVYAVRFLAFAALPSAAWVLPVQALHGLSFGAFLIASVTLAHKLAGPAHAGAAQALLAATSFGLGSITGSLVGGALLERVGTPNLFRGAAVVTLGALVVLAVNWRGFGNAAPAPALDRSA